MITTDDATAISIVKTIAQSQLKPVFPELAPTRDLALTLAAAFTALPPASASEGELAQAALALLAEDPAFAEPIQIMASQPARPQRYLDPTSIALTTAVLLILQTRIKYKTDASGKSSFEVEKKALGDATLKLVVERLLSKLGL